MTTETNRTAQGSEVREVFPYRTDTQDPSLTDFRASVLPADAPEEEAPDPKAESAVVPVTTSESPSPPEETVPESPALPPAEKVSTPPKVPSPGSRPSSPPKTTGKS